MRRTEQGKLLRNRELQLSRSRSGEELGRKPRSVQLPLVQLPPRAQILEVHDGFQHQPIGADGVAPPPQGGNSKYGGVCTASGQFAVMFAGPRVPMA